jgi:hypothetical protein
MVDPQPRQNPALFSSPFHSVCWNSTFTALAGACEVKPARQAPAFFGDGTLPFTGLACRSWASRARSFARCAVLPRLASAARAFSPLIRDIHDLRPAR